MYSKIFDTVHITTCREQAVFEVVFQINCLSQTNTENLKGDKSCSYSGSFFKFAFYLNRFTCSNVQLTHQFPNSVSLSKSSMLSLDDFGLLFHLFWQKLRPFQNQKHFELCGFLILSIKFDKLSRSKNN